MSNQKKDVPASEADTDSSLDFTFEELVDYISEESRILTGEVRKKGDIDVSDYARMRTGGDTKRAYYLLEKLVTAGKLKKRIQVYDPKRGKRINVYYKPD